MFFRVMCSAFACAFPMVVMQTSTSASAAGQRFSYNQEESSDSLPEKTKKAWTSTVYVAANVFQDGAWRYPRAAGFSFSNKRYILTAAHVLMGRGSDIPKEYRIAVYLPDGTMQMAEVVYVRRGSPQEDPDVLVLKIPNPPPPVEVSELTPAEMGNKTTHLFSIRGGQDTKLRTGVIKNASFIYWGEDRQSREDMGPFRYIRTSAWTMRGDSGSALFDEQFRVLGMVVGADQKSYEGYALPIQIIELHLKKVGVL